MIVVNPYKQSSYSMEFHLFCDSSDTSRDIYDFYTVS